MLVHVHVDHATNIAICMKNWMESKWKDSARIKNIKMYFFKLNFRGFHITTIFIHFLHSPESTCIHVNLNNQLDIDLMNYKKII